MEERTFHINLLELIAAFYALQCFTARVNRASVLLYLDNSTAVAFINKCGGTRSRRLSSMAEDIIRWYEERVLSLKAVHLAGNLNIIADHQSRVFQDQSDWKLSEISFRRIKSQWEMEIDLFAAAWNAQLIKFTSWQPQPGAWAVNAFTFSWENLKAYAFPPFSLILRCLAKTRRKLADLVLITPYWPSQVWFPLALSLANDIPLVLAPSSHLRTSASSAVHPQIQTNSLILIAWKLSSDASKCRDFRRRWRNFCWTETVNPHQLRMKPDGFYGVIVAVKEILIPCRII